MAVEPWGTFAPSAAQRAVIALAHGSFMKRGMFRFWLVKLLMAFRSGPIDFEFMGCRFRGRPWRSSADLGMVFNPDYNGPEIRFLMQHTPPDGTFVDVGLNIGMYGLPLARHLTAGGRVVGIEPHPEALAQFDLNRAASAIHNVTVVATAVGDHDGETFIATDEVNIGASRAGDTGDVKVRLTTLAKVVSEAGLERVDSLKLDIEGYEDRALAPYFETMGPAMWPRAVVIEHLHRNEWQTDVISRMLSLGYAETARTRTNLLLVREAA